MKTLPEHAADPFDRLRTIMEYWRGERASRPNAAERMSIATDDLVAMFAWHDAAAEVLRAVEWCQNDNCRYACPVCKGTRNSSISVLGYHKPDCKLAALIGKE